MPFVDFTEEEKVNIAAIDKQHSDIADIINKVHSDFTAGKRATIIDHLKLLIEEIEKHFETEEGYMKQYHFPGYISHKLEHDRFYNQWVSRFDKIKNDDKTMVDMEQIDGLKRWFFNHLQLSDKKVGEFLNSKGIT